MTNADLPTANWAMAVTRGVFVALVIAAFRWWLDAPWWGCGLAGLGEMILFDLARVRVAVAKIQQQLASPEAFAVFPTERIDVEELKARLLAAYEGKPH